jgi:ubiquinone/menaquinone biosynthesis C-methylase UbiE
MNHQDHVHLLRKGISQAGGIWADLGAGAGAFTLALADLLGPTGRIYAIDKDRNSLQQLERRMQIQFPETQVEYVQADFTYPLKLPPLTGIVMANSLHFVRKKDVVLQQVRQYLQSSPTQTAGRLILVEYNADRGNPWVPYPLSYPTWEALAYRNGFTEVQFLESVPSSFLKEIYSALAL